MVEPAHDPRRLLGVTRFDDFQERLGIARNVLEQRLTHLVDEGVLERVPYSEHPPRFDYVLTEQGRDLWPGIVADGKRPNRNR